MWIDTSVDDTHDAYQHKWQQNQQRLGNLVQRLGINYTAVCTNEDYVKALKHLFKC